MVPVTTYWSGQAVPESRRFGARLLWTETFLYVRFDAEQHEPLVINECSNLAEKVIGLWERDVCEIFIAPDRACPARYFEFEIAPTGEWLDLAIEIRDGERITDWEYRSEMRSAAAIAGSSLVEVIRVPFAALGGTPSTGDIWLGNIFRCVGSGVDRGYLAWRPTMTDKPAFHVPAAFGEMHFI